ncbi:MAG: helix-turn-helix domain-containing protein [Caldilineales bacterium]|nr:helix-turn-helix domain-containing protein [Caldilineales bacterium]MDW8316403.1 helix-turn-helix domain-containing protein [Anaerolineae bacterium]
MVSPASAPSRPEPDRPGGAILRPAEAAEALSVSPATLRRWSRRFAPFLNAAETTGEGGHRRYTPEDLATLRLIKEQLEAGATYDEVEEALRRSAADGASPAAPRPSAPAPEPSPAAGGALVAAAPAARSAAAPADEWPPAAQMLRDALHAVADNQQLLLNAQQANRELLGVVIQDNLNLKDEAAGLQERMLELERELAELRRHYADYRERTETRLRVLEDAVAELMAQRYAPPAGAPPRPPSPPPPSGGQPPERRGFWSKLLGG